MISSIIVRPYISLGSRDTRMSTKPRNGKLIRLFPNAPGASDVKATASKRKWGGSSQPNSYSNSDEVKCVMTKPALGIQKGMVWLYDRRAQMCAECVMHWHSRQTHRNRKWVVVLGMDRDRIQDFACGVACGVGRSESVRFERAFRYQLQIAAPQPAGATPATPQSAEFAAVARTHKTPLAGPPGSALRLVRCHFPQKWMQCIKYG